MHAFLTEILFVYIMQKRAGEKNAERWGFLILEKNGRFHKCSKRRQNPLHSSWNEMYRLSLILKIDA